METDEHEVVTPQQERASAFVTTSAVISILSLLGCALFSPLLLVLPFISLTGLVYGIVALFMSLRDRQYPIQWRAFGAILFGIGVLLFSSLRMNGLMNYGSIPVCSNNQRQLAIAVQMYLQDHDSQFPNSLSEAGNVAARCMVCMTHQYILTSKIPYVYNTALADNRLSALTNPREMMLTADGMAGNDGHLRTFADINVTRHDTIGLASFVDGHTTAIHPMKVERAVSITFVDGSSMRIAPDNEQHRR